MLAAFLLWLGIVPALLITAALVFPVFWGNREKRANYEERVKTTPYRNKNQYVTNVMIDFGFAKEVCFYGLQEFLLEQDISGRCGYLDNPLKKCRQQVTATLNPIAEMELYNRLMGLQGRSPACLSCTVYPVSVSAAGSCILKMGVLQNKEAAESVDSAARFG